ncbi:MAG: T9SS type A sorting domain-containing protein [Lentimicrobium sp.]|nr:T9SS type A sorting domain-containing protein [Lentimicrobium sp.]
MKKNYAKTFMVSFLLLAEIWLLGSTVSAQVTIAQWTFEGDVITPSTGSGTAALVGGTTATFATGYTGTGTGGRAWNSSTYPAQGTGSGTAGVEFLTSTSGFSAISLNWDGRHSNTSANRLRVQYTLTGTDWQNFEANASNAVNTVGGIDKGFDNGRFIADAGDTWYQRGADFSGIAGVAGNAAFGVRIVTEFVDGSNYGAATSTSTYGTSGTLRYDNVTIAGIGSSPMITASPNNLTGFTYTVGNGPSEVQITTLNAFNLTPASGTVTFDTPADFEWSTNGTDFFIDPGSVVYENGSFPGNGNVPVRIRLKAGLSAGTYSGNMVVTGGGAPELHVPLSGSVTSGVEATISSVILPRFIEGATPSNQNRVPFAFHATLSDLLPSSTYKYYNKAVASSDGPDYNGAGNCIFVNPSTGTFTRTTSTSMTTPGQYGEFTSDAAGSYAGWFITEPTGNARFKPGNEIFMRIMLNDGAGGSTEATRLTTSESVKVLGFYTNSADTTGTAIRGISNFAQKNFALLYDNTAGTDRPLYATQVEACGIEFIAGTYAEFYASTVAGSEGSWGGIVPNNNANGVKRVEERSLATGAIVSNHTSDNGVWSGVDTKNPSGGTETVLVINTTLGIGSPESEMGKIFTYGKNLSIELNQQIKGTVQVVNLFGQQVAEFALNGTFANYTLDAPAGVYIVRILSNKGMVSSKVMVK